MPKTNEVLLSDAEIDNRLKESHYIQLKKPIAKRIIKEIGEKFGKAAQDGLFGGTKPLLPLDKYEVAFLLGQIKDLKSIDKRPPSKIPVAEGRKIIMEQYDANPEFAAIVDEEQLTIRAQLMEEATAPGDLNVSKLWDFIDGLITDLNLSRK